MVMSFNNIIHQISPSDASLPKFTFSMRAAAYNCCVSFSYRISINTSYTLLKKTSGRVDATAEEHQLIVAETSRPECIRPRAPLIHHQGITIRFPAGPTVQSRAIMRITVIPFGAAICINENRLPS
jgi:hypothetical protein